MSNYDNFIGDLANKQKDANMQMHLRNNADTKSIVPNDECILEELPMKVQFGFQAFLNDLVKVLYHVDMSSVNNYMPFSYHYSEGPFSSDYQDDVCDALSYANEKSLDDPLFSEKINFKEEYSKYLGGVFEKSSDDRNYDIDMNLYFVPAAPPDTQNILRLNITEKHDNYLVNGNIEFFSDREIFIKRLTKKNLKDNTISDANIDDLHFDKTQLLIIKDYLIEVYKKTELIDDSEFHK